MRIFIAGASGLIGRELKNSFLNSGINVIGSRFQSSDFGDDIFLDVKSDSSFKQLPDIPFDVVINNVGIVNAADRFNIREVNAEGTRRLLEWAKKRSCKHFIQISSTGVYGLRAVGKNIRESTRLRLISLAIPYQRSKALAEGYVSRSGIPFTMLRLPAIMGRGDTILTPSIVSGLLTNTFSYCGDGKSIVSIADAKFIPSLVGKIIDVAPTNCAFNAATNHIPWVDIVQAYADSLRCVRPFKRAPFLSVLGNLSNASYLFAMASSRFGAHYPTDKLESTFSISMPNSWRSTAKEAALHYAANVNAVH